MGSETFGLVKPHALLKVNGYKIITFIKRKGFSILEHRFVTLSWEETEDFFPNSLDWFKRIGEKVMKNCKQGEINPVVEFGTNDLIELGKIVRGWNIEDLTNQVSLALLITGGNGNIIQEFREIVGSTDPTQAAEGTIRKIFSHPNESGILATKEHRIIRNAIHAPDSEEAFLKEKTILWNAQLWEYEPEKSSPYDE